MLFTGCLKISKHSSSTTYCTAVASAERPAGSLSFQRYQPSFPPDKNAISAALRELPASQFSGSIAIFAAFAAYSARSALK